MAVSHTVKEGEHLSGIAARYGFRDYRTIWNHPQNADLKSRRRDPHVLNPGDVVFIPDKKLKSEDRPTGARHVFQVTGQPLKLRLTLRDFDSQPIADTPCELEVDGAKYQLTSDASGTIQQAIPKTAAGGTLRVPSLDLELPLLIGHLDPEDQEAGSKARLINLGYYALGMDDDDEDGQLRYAVEEFQCDQKANVTGELDASTCQRLRTSHGV